MLNILLAALPLVTSPPSVAEWLTPTNVEQIDGKATYYRQGLMRGVAEYWGYEGTLFVALNRRGDRGRTVWIKKGAAIYEAISVDCAQRGAHYERRKRLRLVLEVPYWLAMQWGMKGSVDINVLFKQPAMRPI